MVLYTKCIFSPKEEFDGIRVCVMSRLTLNDGITADTRLLQEGLFDEWLIELAPPSKLLGDYYKRNLSWIEFEKRYLEHIRSTKVKDYVISLSNRALNEDLTILCVEQDYKACHRHLLAEACKILNPNLIVVHR